MGSSKEKSGTKDNTETVVAGGTGSPRHGALFRSSAAAVADALDWGG